MLWLDELLKPQQRMVPAMVPASLVTPPPASVRTGEVSKSFYEVQQNSGDQSAGAAGRPGLALGGTMTATGSTSGNGTTR